MKNSDTPAMPTGKTFDTIKPSYGLTKREHFAGLAMQALIPIYAERTHLYDTPQEWIECQSTSARAMADRLLEALEND